MFDKMLGVLRCRQGESAKLLLKFIGQVSIYNFLIYFHASPFRSSSEGRSCVPPLVERKSGGTPLPL